MRNRARRARMMTGYDSGDESEAERQQRAREREGSDTVHDAQPGWYKQLRNQLRFAQQGRWWERDAGSLSSLDSTRRGAVEHEEAMWKEICDEMAALVDKGCGHGLPGRGPTRTRAARNVPRAARARADGRGGGGGGGGADYEEVKARIKEKMRSK